MPKVIISDQGTEFAGVTKELADRMGIDRRVSTPYHSQTNGLVERMNRTIKDLLVKSLEKRVDWHIQLPLILMSIRSHTTRATGYSSFELVTGRKMIWPQDIELYRQENDDFRFTEDDIDVFESQEKALHEERLKRLEELANVRKKARENIINEQSKYKARYDQLHNPQCYEVGDKVTLQNDQPFRRIGTAVQLFVAPKVAHVVQIKLEASREKSTVLKYNNAVKKFQAWRSQRANTEPDEELASVLRTLAEENKKNKCEHFADEVACCLKTVEDRNPTLALDMKRQVQEYETSTKADHLAASRQSTSSSQERPKDEGMRDQASLQMPLDFTLFHIYCRIAESEEPEGSQQANTRPLDHQGQDARGRISSPCVMKLMSA
ncbi:hypothetical protein QR680_009293 [Steinernema hermaphroditum]|uniref:Integrase catalytic domain-containing protein n=1 Tax=Steinernema hermaphroditum TaxID=289476 RepID=A0AA39IL20_9BILA|nr:hypothetical protein QR680_009293 [Steinernema hermaphroditum]